MDGCVDNQMKICYIFGAAPIADCSYIQIEFKEHDTVICADGGYQLAKRLGITPDWIVGDFDSNHEEIDFNQVIRVKPEKDDTDLYLAVNHGKTLGYTHFVIYGALGGRLDHTVANIQMLMGFVEEGIHITIKDEQNDMTAIQNDKIELLQNKFHYFSLFSLTEKSEGVTIEGGKYPLYNATLTNNFPLGVSNEVSKEKAVISVKKGVLLIIQSKDMNRIEKTGI